MFEALMPKKRKVGTVNSQSLTNSQFFGLLVIVAITIAIFRWLGWV